MGKPERSERYGRGDGKPGARAELPKRIFTRYNEGCDTKDHVWMVFMRVPMKHRRTHPRLHHMWGKNGGLTKGHRGCCTV